VLTADRDTGSIIFASTLDDLARRHPGRFEVRRHLDERDGLPTEARLREFAEGDPGADFYLCGPGPFMDLAERAVLSFGAEPAHVHIEDFTPEPEPSGEEKRGTVTIVLGRKRETLSQHSGETLLQSARRAGLSPPFSCESGHCATCMARITEGEVKMRVNDALEDDEVANGWALTCQSEPVTPHVTVVYED
jgi:ferredoxin